MELISGYLFGLPVDGPITGVCVCVWGGGGGGGGGGVCIGGGGGGGGTVTIKVDSAKSVTLLLGTGFLQIIIIKKCSVAVLFL